MFSDEVDRRASPFGLSKPGVAIGTLVLVAAAGALVSARALPFLFGAVAISIAIAGARVGRDWLADAVPRISAAIAGISLFFAFAAISAIWSLDPALTLSKVAQGGVIIAAAIFAANAIGAFDRGTILRIAEGLWLGLALGLLYFLVEILSDQSLKIWAYNAIGIKPGDVKANWFTFDGGKLVAIKDVDLTRNAAPVTLLMWPALLAVLGAVRRPWVGLVGGVLLILATAVVMLSPHETSKLAVIIGALAFLAARLSPTATIRGLQVAWVAACLFVLPVVFALYGAGLQNAGWLPGSAQHRVIIWNYTAQEALKSPLIGAGALSTYVVGQTLKPEVAELPGERHPRELSQHAHNVFLQTWYELGAAGALLLAFAGWTGLATLGSRPPTTQPFAIATAASAMTMAAASYGFWQTWFLAMFGFSLVALAIGARAFEGRVQVTATSAGSLRAG